MRYEVINDQYLHVLVAKVNRQIAEGWRPLGGIMVVTYVNSDEYYYQAMVKDEPTVKQDFAAMQALGDAL